jgi:hypothetical protein
MQDMSQAYLLGTDELVFVLDAATASVNVTILPGALAFLSKSEKSKGCTTTYGGCSRAGLSRGALGACSCCGARLQLQDPPIIHLR